MSTQPHLESIISATELKECIKNITLLDVREPSEYAVSHISGCKLIPLGELLQRAENELSKEGPIVIYCAHGIRSMRGLLALKQLGYQNLRSLEGGIAAWEELNGTAHPSH